MQIPSKLRFGKKRGFTLVELMIVVAIIGVLAALAIYGVRKYLLNAKTAEARSALGRISKDASASWDRERLAGTIVPVGEGVDITNQLCESAINPVPATLAEVGAKKYQSDPADWNAAGWSCLRFSMQDPQYYQYMYTSDGSGEGSEFTATATGDLDGDTTPSVFTMKGLVQKSASGDDLVLTITPSIQELNPEE